MYTANLKDVIDDSFTQYAGAVIQSRALVDVRDCVKPSARQVYYNMFVDKYTNEKPFSKTLKVLGGCMKTYIHGDSSCEGIIMRSGQPFYMRYPLVEVEGSYGNLMESGNWAAPRYTASRLSELSNFLVKETTVDTVDEWADNYDDTMQYPRVLSSLGFYNIVNGSQGIAVGVASSIPSFNIVDVNEALKKLILNPDADYEDIVCYPDFPTGGTIVNKDEVAESLKVGQGKPCVIRGKLSYNKKDNVIIVQEIPYGVYTNTICVEIEKLVNNDPGIGIVNINDLTGEQVNIKIYLAPKYKNNLEAVQGLVETLFEKTSLQKSFSINMTMLEEGKYPKVFGWKEALSAHLDHEKQTYIKLFTYKQQQLQHRLLIVEAIMAAINNINDVVEIIKNSSSINEAQGELQKILELNEEQVKAILDIKLSRLARLEFSKFEQEKTSLEKDIKTLTKILNSDKLLCKQMIRRFDKVIEKFGDERRTKVINKEIKKVQPVEKPAESLVIAFNQLGYLQSIPEAQYKDNGFEAYSTTSKDYILLFSSLGKCYRLAASDIKQCGNKDKGVAIGTLLDLDTEEAILYVCGNESKNIAIAASDGSIKRIETEQFYGTTRNKNGMAIMKDSSDIISIQECKEDDIITLATKSKQISFAASEVRLTGKTSGGIRGIAANEPVESMIIENENDFTGKLQSRGGKGIKK